MTISNHKYVYYNKNVNKRCKCWYYSRLINRKNKIWINKHFHNKLDALCYKFIMNLRVKAGHSFVKIKRNTWYE